MILVLGRRGMLAGALKRELERRNATAMFVGAEEADLSHKGTVAEIVSRYAPQLVVNAAAYTAVDRAESEPQAAFALNADMPGEAAAACKVRNVPFVNVSTDYVFDGARGEPYREQDAPNPLNVYGKSKHAGEQAVAASGAVAVSIRTSWVLGVSARNFIATMLRLARERKEITVVDDQWGRATLVEDLAVGCLEVGADLQRRGATAGGLLHLSGTKDATWAMLAQKIMACAKSEGLPAAEIKPISSREFGAAAIRPLDSRLDCTVYETRFRTRTRDWIDELPNLVRAVNAVI